jgi:hypothetical protein
MFEEDDLIERWCTVCDRQIKVALPPPSSSTASSSSTAAQKKPAQTGTVAPGKYIAPKPPTFKRSKTGTIRVSERFACLWVREKRELVLPTARGPGDDMTTTTIGATKHTWTSRPRELSWVALGRSILARVCARVPWSSGNGSASRDELVLVALRGGSLAPADLTGQTLIHTTPGSCTSSSRHHSCILSILSTERNDRVLASSRVSARFLL